MRAPTPYDWTAEPMREVPQAAPAEAASLDLKNSSLLFACIARRYVSPKTGPRTARDAAWLKRVPRAMADGFTGGRSNGRWISCCFCVFSSLLFSSLNAMGGGEVGGGERDIQLRDMLMAVMCAVDGESWESVVVVVVDEVVEVVNVRMKEE